MAHAQKPVFVLRAKRTSPFKSAGGASVQSTTGSRGVRISGSNAGYTMFRGSVKGTGYPLHSPVSNSLPLQCVPSHFSWSLTNTAPDLSQSAQSKCSCSALLCSCDPQTLVFRPIDVLEFVCIGVRYRSVAVRYQSVAVRA